MLLHLLVLAPFAVALLMVVNSKEDYKAATRMAILFGLLFLGMSVALIASGNTATTPVEWFKIPGCKGPSYYYLYSHGLGAWMVFLSCGLSLVSLISARGILGANYRNFAIGIFALMGAMNGTFLAADAVLFFFFFEAMVIPAAILIASFGGEKRKQAAMTFAIYTLVGSAPMMVALWYLLTIADNSLLVSLAVAIQSVPESTQLALLMSFLIAFIVKTPIFPFHGWQAITYSEASAPLSAILTGAMSKAGVFSLSEAMLPAVLVLLVAHGISAGVQYYLIGVAERMTGTRNIDEMGGLAHKNPAFSFLFGAAGVMALAVPGTAGFIGEFSVLLSLWDLSAVCAGIMGFVMILSAAYVLRFIQKVIFGNPAREYTEGKRAGHLEGFAYGVMLVLLLVFGFHPSFITNSLNLNEEEVAEQVAEEPAAEAPAEEVVEEEEVEEDVEPLESHIVSSADIAKLDSSLTQAGFSEEERKELIKQVIETEANMAKATAYAAEKQQREEEEARIRDAANKGYEEFDVPMESQDESAVKNEEASND